MRRISFTLRDAKGPKWRERKRNVGQTQTKDSPKASLLTRLKPFGNLLSIDVVLQTQIFFMLEKSGLYKLKFFSWLEIQKKRWVYTKNAHFFRLQNHFSATL